VSGSVTWHEGYQVNISRSLPLGIYQLSDRDPGVGDFVAFCVPPRLSQLEIFHHLTVTPCVSGSLFGLPVFKWVANISGTSADLFVRGESERSVYSSLLGPTGMMKYWAWWVS
jgi:hypothetical protein